MWLLLAFMSAALLGFYDSFKKKALRGNAVIPVLFINTVICSLIFLPFIVLSAMGALSSNSPLHVGGGGWEMHRYVILKSVIVLSSWLAGYIGMKHLPLTIVGPINATRPVMVLVGALLVYGERLNAWRRKWTLRQVPNGLAVGWRRGTRQDGRAIVVQHLSVGDDARDARHNLVSAAQD